MNVAIDFFDTETPPSALKLVIESFFSPLSSNFCHFIDFRDEYHVKKLLSII
jgi:hypothetical protein